MTEQPQNHHTVVDLHNYQGWPVLWSVVAVDEGDGKPSAKVSLQQEFLEDAPEAVRMYAMARALRKVADLLNEHALVSAAGDEDEEF